MYFDVAIAAWATAPLRTDIWSSNVSASEMTAKGYNTITCFNEVVKVFI